MTEDVTLIGVCRTLVPRTGDKGELPAIVKSALEFYKAFVNGGYYTDSHKYIVLVDFDGYSILNVVLEMALKR
jgi:hypothetical protein